MNSHDVKPQKSSIFARIDPQVAAEEALVIDVLEELAEYMSAHGISQAQLASRLGVSRAAVSQMFKSGNLSVRKLAAVAHVLGAAVSVRVSKTPAKVARLTTKVVSQATMHGRGIARARR